jgi:hypothetical protein
LSTILHLFINRYRFVELKYRRSEQNKKEGSDGGARPARIETVVIFLPDIHSCMPNRSEWDGVQQQYKLALEKFLTANNEPEPAASSDKESVGAEGAAASSTADVVIKVADDEKSAAETTSNVVEAKIDQSEDVTMADDSSSSAVAATTTVAAVAADVLDGAQNDIPIVNLEASCD